MTRHDSKPSVGRLIFTPGDPRVLIGEQQVTFPAQELALLQLLAREAGRPVSTATAARHLARGGEPLSDTTVAVYVHRLRARLEPVGLSIRSFRGLGYTLEPIERQNG